MKEIFKTSSSIKEAIVSAPESQALWILNPSYLYSTKSALRLIRADSIQNLENLRPWKWKGIWKLKIIPKIKTFLWKLILGGLTTKSRLSQKDGQALLNVNFALTMRRMNFMFSLVALLQPKCGDMSMLLLI